jgi:DDE family transposase
LAPTLPNFYDRHGEQPPPATSILLARLPRFLPQHPRQLVGVTVQLARAVIKAVNNKDRNFTRSSLREFIRAADARLDDYLKRLDEGDVEDGATGCGARTKNLAEKIAALSEKRGRYQAMLTQLERSGEDQISLTDPDSRAMAAYTKVGVGYNVQVAVDAKHKLIVEQAVTNPVVDVGLLTQTVEPARAILEVETIDVVADRGYFKTEDIEACEKAGCVPRVSQA